MARWLRIREARLDADAVVALLHAGVAELPGVVVTADPPTLSWTDGPSSSSVAAAVGPLEGWTFGAEPGERVVAVRRTLSRPAVAVALVRFYASQGRHYTTADERGGAAFDALTDVDDPARSGYPIVDTVADLLLATAGPDESTVDALSARLRAIGYEPLWAQAFAALE